MGDYRELIHPFYLWSYSVNVDNIHLMVYWESIHLVSYLMQELIFRSVGFAVWFVGLIRYLKFASKLF